MNSGTSEEAVAPGCMYVLCFPCIFTCVVIENFCKAGIMCCMCYCIHPKVHDNDNNNNLEIRN